MLKECSDGRSMFATHLFIINIRAIVKQRGKGTADNKHLTFTKPRVPE